MLLTLIIDYLHRLTPPAEAGIPTGDFSLTWNGPQPTCQATSSTLGARAHGKQSTAGGAHTKCEIPFQGSSIQLPSSDLFDPQVRGAFPVSRHQASSRNGEATTPEGRGRESCTLRAVAHHRLKTGDPENSEMQLLERRSSELLKGPERRRMACIQA